MIEYPKDSFLTVTITKIYGKEYLKREYGMQNSDVTPYVSLFWASLMIGRWASASGIFTSNDEKAKWTAERIEAGIVWHNDWFVDGVNLPGGGYKKSGYGRDGGIDSLYSYCQTKRVTKRLQ